MGARNEKNERNARPQDRGDPQYALSILTCQLEIHAHEKTTGGKERKMDCQLNQGGVKITL